MAHLFKNKLALLLAVFLLRLPPIYYFGIPITILSSHILSILVFFFLFSYILKDNLTQKKSFLIVNTEIVLLIAFLLTQSLSILPAENINIFLQRYSKVVIGFLIFIVYRVSKQNNQFNSEKLAKMLAWGSLFNILVQMTVYFFPIVYKALAGKLILNNLFAITMANLEAGKILDDSYLEISLPFILYFYFNRTQTKKRLFWLLSSCSIVGIAFLSNFRYRFLTAFFGVLIPIMLMKKIKHSFVFTGLLVFFILFTIYGGRQLSYRLSTYSVIERFSLENKSLDYNTISWRFDMFKAAIEMATKSFFGSGLGNFYEALDKTGLFINTKQPISYAALLSGPHNIFFQFLGETGFLGLFTFLILLIQYAKTDLQVLLTNKFTLRVAYIIGFWLLILSVQFFPAINLTFYFLFFLLRAVI